MELKSEKVILLPYNGNLSVPATLGFKPDLIHAALLLNQADSNKEADDAII